jgi:hypothetical protein
MTVAPPKAPPKSPPPPPSASPSRPAADSSRGFKIKTGPVAGAQRIVFYGPGGVGKSELCSLLKNVGINPLFLDIEGGTKALDVARLDEELAMYEDLLAALRDPSVTNGYDAIVIDSFTKAQEMAESWVIRNVKHSKDKTKVIRSLMDYGFGEDKTFIYEAFLQLLGELDNQVRKGRHVIGICHDCTANVPNPEGEDFIRYEPRLQSPKSGQSSIRHRVKEWCDHLLYIGYDVSVDEEGKAKGHGSRCIYPTERPTYWAKSRSLSESIVYEQGQPDLWKKLFNKE